MSGADRPLGALVAAVRALYAGEIAGRGEATRSLIEVDAALARVGAAECLPVPARQPGCRHLRAALEAAGAAPLAGVAHAFGALEPWLRWLRNPNYSEDKVGADYLDNYAYCDFVGRFGLADPGGVNCGFLLLGPGVLYPDHAHPAVEVYHVVSGNAQWRRGDGRWHTRAPGSCIHHRSGVAHATRTGAEPLLALYCWSGEIGVAADLLPAAR